MRDEYIIKQRGRVHIYHCMYSSHYQQPGLSSLSVRYKSIDHDMHAMRGVECGNIQRRSSLVIRNTEQALGSGLVIPRSAILILNSNLDYVILLISLTGMTTFHSRLTETPSPSSCLPRAEPKTLVPSSSTHPLVSRLTHTKTLL